MATYDRLREIVQTWDNAILTALHSINPNRRTINTDNITQTFREMFELAYGARSREPQFADRFFRGYVDNTIQTLNSVVQNPSQGLSDLAQAASQDSAKIINPYSSVIENLPRELRDRVNAQTNNLEGIALQGAAREDVYQDILRRNEREAQRRRRARQRRNQQQAQEPEEGQDNNPE